MAAIYAPQASGLPILLWEPLWLWGSHLSPRNSNSISALLGADTLSVPACHPKYKYTIGYFQIINVHSAGVFIPVCLGLCLLSFPFLHQISLWCGLNRCQSHCHLLCLNDSGSIFDANSINWCDRQHSIWYKSSNRTHPKHLLPIWIVHVIIDDLLTMLRCHLPCRWGNVIQRFPKCLNDFTIHNSHTGYECWSISGKAFMLVAMHMKQPYGSGNVGETCR